MKEWSGCGGGVGVDGVCTYSELEWSDALGVAGPKVIN